MIKKFAAILFLLSVFVVMAGADTKKIRFISTAGFAFQNDIIDSTGFTGGGGVHLAYPVSSRTKLFNVELAIANWYTVFPSDNDMLALLRFGFGIRVFLNSFDLFRPYFTHDITTHIVWVDSREGHAPTHGVLLGLGVDFPFPKEGTSGISTSSWFFDVSYSSFELVYFDAEKEAARYLLFSCGYSWEL